jgi:hypothetical protein
MIENLIVALIVGAALWSAWSRYRPGKKAGCGSGGGSGSDGGCDSCKGCATPAASEAPPARRVIRIHSRRA